MVRKSQCTQVSCPVSNCGATVSKTSAVLHMSYHQMKNENELPICGFCGKEGHGAPELNKTGKKWAFPEECGFAGNNLTQKALKVISGASPLSNYPLKCDLCAKIIWRFDLEKHYEKDHKDETCPVIGIISKEEKKILNEKTYKGKPKMVKRDWERLTDAELKLFSYKDFWNYKAHKWASGDAGRFGKQQSERVKRVFGAENFT